jgi:hypothetical protein
VKTHTTPASYSAEPLPLPSSSSLHLGARSATTTAPRLCAPLPNSPLSVPRGHQAPLDTPAWQPISIHLATPARARRGKRSRAKDAQAANKGSRRPSPVAPRFLSPAPQHQ